MEQPGLGLERLHLDSKKQGDFRTEGERDHDRILYSSAFLRLAGVAQVVHVADGTVVHNRLTHSLKVARIGRGLATNLAKSHPKIAEQIGGINADCVECAALAHDIGHPPFGHLAEEVLDQLVRDELGEMEGFEGNAQSFRVVTSLATRKEAHSGLNLTRRTLNGILKYPWMRGTSGKEKKKWGAYSTEKREFEFARQGFPSGSKKRSVEAEIMDFADDVAYSTHDVEDFYRAGLVPLDRLITDDKEADRFLEATFDRWKGEGLVVPSTKPFSTAFEAIRKLIADYLPKELTEPYTGTRRQRAAIHTTTSILIKRFFEGVSLQGKTDAPFVVIAGKTRNEIAILKELTWHYVLRNPALAEQEYGQRTIIRSLFKIFREQSEKKDLVIFSPRYREQLKEAYSATADQKAAITRIIVDVIAELTEHHAYALHARLTGHKPTTLLDLAQR